MNNFIVFLHIFSSIIFLGPITIATSAFPRFAKQNNLEVMMFLNRISKFYGILSLLVPITGLFLTIKFELFKVNWIHISLLLTIIAVILLVLLIIPTQNVLINNTVNVQKIKLLNIYSGFFALSWVIVLFEMIYK